MHCFFFGLFNFLETYKSSLRRADFHKSCLLNVLMIDESDMKLKKCIVLQYRYRFCSTIRFLAIISCSSTIVKLLMKWCVNVSQSHQLVALSSHFPFYFLMVNTFEDIFRIYWKVIRNLEALNRFINSYTYFSVCRCFIVLAVSKSFL